MRYRGRQLLAGTALIATTILTLALQATPACAETITVFEANNIHFNPDNSSQFDTEDVKAEDNGRVIVRTVDLPEAHHTRIMAHLAIHPIPKDEISVHDKWDRAGNVRLAIDGQPDCEIVKFITAYGGETAYDVDVSHLAPLLGGSTTIKASIDTWVSPAWTVDFSLEFLPDSLERVSRWVTSVMNVPSMTRELCGDTGLTYSVEVPEGQKRVLLHYYVSGHCTDGTDADEFVKKDNVISVDGVVVYRYQPWRDDCRRFRDINPYTRRWSDGWWSSDYNRSGWCPGDRVAPLELDLTDHLTPGKHTITFLIENIRPKGDDNHYGYWRVSAQLLGADD